MRALNFVLLLAPLALVLSLEEAGAASLEGAWSGSGVVEPKNGERESVRCRISYTKEGEKVFGVAAKCTTTSTKVHQTGSVLMVNPTTYIGDFYNPDYDVSGRVRVTVKGSVQTVTFTSARGSGSVTLTKR